MELVHSDGYRMYSARDGRIPEKTFIICSEHSSGILFRPHIAGKELLDRTEKMAEIFMDALGREVLKGSRTEDLTELVFLAGGLYYQLNSGFRRRFGMALPQCFLGIKRQRVEGSEGEFTAVATYENFESLPDNGTVIIGDTIATGATLQKGIYHLLDALATKKYRLKNLVICSLACSIDGAVLLKEVETRVRAEHTGANVWLFVAEELFHLMPDGTDLRFLYEDALMPNETRKRIMDTYGEYLGKEMKCAVFDWGTRCKNPLRHFAEFMEFVHEMKKRELDPKSSGVLSGMESETKKMIAEFSRPL
ncbi:MAG: hypothetical protein AB1324_03860 [Candidatus Micrarchaeota archaeon]